ncbi:MAG: hypothetical protein Q4E99_05370 [Bacillota bacterium]|nr:hypothetical protein [Bacillota bacterium]
MTQQELFDYLKANPLSVNVHFGDLFDLKGQDYIFVSMVSETLIPSDDKGSYKTALQITIATKDFDRRKELVDYVKDFINVSVRYDIADQFQYFLAHCDCEMIFYAK